MQQEKKYPIGGYAPGNYHCNCCKCGTFFLGDKRAVECELCAVAAKEKFDAMSPEEQAEVIKRNVEAVNEVFKDWGRKPDVNLVIMGHGIPADEDDQLNFSIERGDLWKARALAAEKELEERKGAVWVKASERLPYNNNLVHLNYKTDKTNFKTTGYYEPTVKLWYNQNGILLGWAPNLEWLDESGQSKEGGNPVALIQNILLSDIDAPVFTHSPQFKAHFDYIKKKFLEIIETRNEQPVEQISEDAHEKEVMMKAFGKVRQIFEGRQWIMEGRGSYPYNDDRYREEVRYMYNEFDALVKDTWANIKSHSSDYRKAIIAEYLKGEQKENEAVDKLLEFARDCAKNWDCDTDGHKYNTGCRKCEANKLYNEYKKQNKQ